MAELDQTQTPATGQTTDKTKAKPVAVDPQAKQVARSGKLTSEERVATLDELIKDEVQKVLKKNNGHYNYDVSAKYNTPRGDVAIYLRPNSSDKTKIDGYSVILISGDSRQTTTYRSASYGADGQFKELTQKSWTTLSHNQEIQREKEPLKTEWAEKFGDNLIRDALKAKVVKK